MKNLVGNIKEFYIPYSIFYYPNKLFFFEFNYESSYDYVPVYQTQYYAYINTNSANISPGKFVLSLSIGNISYKFISTQVGVPL